MLYTEDAVTTVSAQLAISSVTVSMKELGEINEVPLLPYVT